MSEMFTSFATIQYHTTWIIAKCDDSIVDYYRWFYWKATGLKLMRPKNGAHISIARGEDEGIMESRWKRNINGPRIEFYYSNELITKDNYIWMPVWGEQLYKVRENVGLPTQPILPFHMTVGRTT